MSTATKVSARSGGSAPSAGLWWRIAKQLAPLLPRRSDYHGLRRSWPRDLAAGVTVGVVALPLALGFSVATGVGASVGLVTAVIAGAVAAVCGGSSLQVSGPTGAMTVAKPQQENAAAAAAIAVGRFVEHPHWVVIGLLALAVVLTAGLPRLHRSLPSSLLAVIAVTLVAGLSGAHVTRIGALPSSLPVPSLPHPNAVGGLLGPAFVVAFLAAIESLMSARAADGMADASRHDPNRELFGQGLANIASGICGGMPATGAIARTAVNARAGAQTRLAALVHALVLAVIVYAATGLVSKIPLVALAGVLIVTAYRMVERHTVHSVLHSTRSDALVFILTAVGTVAFDLIKAVGVGLIVAMVLAVAHLAKTAQAVQEPLQSDGLTSDAEHDLLASHILTYRIDGPLFFGASARFLSELTATSAVRVVILRLSSLAMLDATGARAIGELVEQLASRRITVLLKGASAEHTRLLAAVGALAPVLAAGHVFASLPDAVAHARGHVSRHALDPAVR